MGIFQQFPYSNFHEMNSDQIIKIMREMQDEWAATKEEWASMQEFINNYFETLDVSEEVLAAMQVLALNGTLNQILDPTIATTVTDWLDENITPTTPAIDNTLLISGAGADAKVTGERLNIISNYGIILAPFVENEYLDVFNNGEIKPYNGFSRTNYIDITDLDKLYISSPAQTLYCGFFTSANTYISAFTINAGENTITIPQNAKYALISAQTSIIENIILKNSMFNALTREKLFFKRKYILIGDSYGEGYNPDGNVTGWCQRVVTQLQLNINDYVIKYKGGCGFYHRSDNKNFETLLDEAGATVDKLSITDIIVCGGWNDNSDTIQNVYNAVLSFIAKVRAQYPNATMHIGMIGASNDAAVKTRLQNTVLYCYQYGALADVARYINNIEYAISYNNLASDGIHINADGEVQVTNAIVQYLKTGSSYIPYRFFNQIKTS